MPVKGMGVQVPPRTQTIRTCRGPGSPGPCSFLVVPTGSNCLPVSVRVVIVEVMFSPYGQNELLLSMFDALVGDGADLEPVRTAFESTKGDFAAKFTAAVQARLAEMAVPELYIDLPDRPEELRKSELDALVRPAAEGFLRSYPTKAELVDQVRLIRRRQERRPAWIPRVDRNGEPLSAPETDPADDDARPERPLVVSTLAELGDVTVLLPAGTEDRPELTMEPGGIGEWEAALCTLLGITFDTGPAATIPIDAQSNEALVPEEVRWWPTEPGPAPSAAQDPGVASELLATSATLGGLPVIDSSPGTDEVEEAVAAALVSAGDWRYSARWLLDTWDPGPDVHMLTTARAAIAGWADDGHSGLIVYVYGGALHGLEGLIGLPAPLHSYLLCITRSPDGTDTVETVHRMALSCPGDNWCHRGGCPDTDFPEAAALLRSTATAGHAAEAADREDSWASETYQRLYGASGMDEDASDVLEYLEATLSSAGWVELGRATWEGGLEDSLLRRGEHCLTASYDPVTRQIRLTDGKPELEMHLQMLAEDGLLTEIDGRETIDTSETARQQWSTELLTAAEDLLRERINELQTLAVPIQGALLGQHPHADGTLRGPESTSLTERQLTTLLRAAGLLP